MYRCIYMCAIFVFNKVTMEEQQIHVEAEPSPDVHNTGEANLGNFCLYLPDQIV